MCMHRAYTLLKKTQVAKIPGGSEDEAHSKLLSHIYASFSGTYVTEADGCHPDLRRLTLPEQTSETGSRCTPACCLADRAVLHMKACPNSGLINVRRPRFTNYARRAPNRSADQNPQLSENVGFESILQTSHKL